jgi:soluble lytic murein transglycosylase-like protein
MKTIIATLGLVFSFSTCADLNFFDETVDRQHKVMLEVRKVTSQVTKNNPNITKLKAREIASIIVKKAKKHRIPKDIFTAILAQESMYKVSAKNCTGKNCTDIGISQIHYKTIKRYGFNKKRLLTDLEYSIEAGCIVLKDFMNRYSHKEKNWYSRYNSSNPAARKRYEKSVKRFL